MFEFYFNFRLPCFNSSVWKWGSQWNADVLSKLFKHNTIMIRFSALLPIGVPFRISAPFECVFINKRPYSNTISLQCRQSTYQRSSSFLIMPHHKNSGLRLSFPTILSLRMHNSFKRKVSSSSLVLNIRLFLQKEISALSLISDLPWGTKSKRAPWAGWAG